jgi:1-deoxy-D-xylulose-5-phosphate reductoisomerase
MKVAILGFSGALGSQCVEVLKEELTKGTLSVEEVYLTSMGSSPQRMRSLLKGMPPFKLATVRKIEEFVGEEWYYGWGEKAVDELSSAEVGLSFVLVPGLSSVKAVLNAVKGAEKVALASKEATVFVERDVLFSRTVLPLDSEHFSLQVLLRSTSPSSVRRALITASGGAVWKRKTTNLKREEVLEHPRWKMGAVITVNSSTMFNKLLEVYESHYLFSLPLKRVEALIE